MSMCVCATMAWILYETTTSTTTTSAAVHMKIRDYFKSPWKMDFSPCTMILIVG